MALVYIAEICVKRCFDSERYQLRSTVRVELVLPLAWKATLGHKRLKYTAPTCLQVAGLQDHATKFYMKLETIALHFTSL